MNSVMDEQTSGTRLVSVEGEVDIASAPGLSMTLSEALRDRPRRLVVDLCDVTFLDSCGLAVLLRARRQADAAKVELRLVCDVRSVLRLLEITRLDREFDVHPSLDDALLH